MRKIALLLAIVLVVSIPLSVQATTPRTEIVPSLSFNGTTAKCSVFAAANNTSDYVVVQLKLFQGNKLITQWAKSSNRSVSISENCTVVKGLTYTLTAEVMINGGSYPTRSVSKTC
jgi:hypothetical protein